MATVTFPISIAANDGTGNAQNNFWPPTTWTDDSDNATNELFVSKGSFSSLTYYEELAFMRWDTSSLPASAVITGVNLLVYVTAKADDDNFSLVGDYFDFGGEPTVSGDRIETASPSIFTALDITGISTAGVLTIALTSFSGISVSGFTGIRLTLSAGTPTLGALVNNSVSVAAFEHAQQEPRLEVTYTAGAQVPMIHHPVYSGAVG